MQEFSGNFEGVFGGVFDLRVPLLGFFGDFDFIVADFRVEVVSGVVDSFGGDLPQPTEGVFEHFPSFFNVVDGLVPRHQRNFENIAAVRVYQALLVLV